MALLLQGRLPPTGLTAPTGAAVMIEVPTGTEPLVQGLSFIGPRQSASCTYLPELVLVLCFCLVQRYDH